MERHEQVVHDEVEPCPYLPGRLARMPLRWQLAPLDGPSFDQSLAEGDRRVGRMLYRPMCADCRECEPIRVPVSDFAPSRSQRRIWRRNEDVVVEMGPATFSDEKLALYNRHKAERGLSTSDRQMTRRGYEGWFLQSCSQTVEMRYRVDGRLVGVGILDVGARDASSVYFFFDPDESKRSLGVFSVLVELSWQKRRGGRYHYLGLFVADCEHLSYKAQYSPHERRIGGEWVLFPLP